MKNFIIVTGVERSGTSAIARIFKQRFSVCMGHQLGDTWEDKRMWAPTRELVLGDTSVEHWVSCLEESHMFCGTAMAGVKDPHFMMAHALFFNMMERDYGLAGIVLVERYRGAVTKSMVKTNVRLKPQDAEWIYDIRTDAFERTRGAITVPVFSIDMSSYRSDAEIEETLQSFGFAGLQC